MSSKTTIKKISKDDIPFDLEQQCLLKLPPGPSMALRREVEMGSQTLKDKVSIEFQPDMRHGAVRFGGQLFFGKLLDLPTIMESYKTTDSKTFYKTADICQILMCTSEDEGIIEETESPKKKDKDKKFQFNHGITPPLKNVRKRRFRKTLKKKYQEQPEIEKEVKRLFRMDNEAIDVKWEVVTEEENPVTDANNQVLQGEVINAANTTVKSFDFDENEIFGEVSSSEEEEEDDREVNIMDSGDEGRSVSQLPDDGPGHGSSLLDENQDTMDSMPGDIMPLAQSPEADMMNSDIQAKLEELEQEIKDLRQCKQEQENQLEITEEAELKEQIQESLDTLTQEEQKKHNEYEILISMQE